MLVDQPQTIHAILAFLVAGVVAWLLVPPTEVLARRIGAIDYPNERSLHETPTPKLGGLAILAGVLVAGVLFMHWGDNTRAILAGAAVISLVGAIDDVLDLNPALKLLGQAVGAAIPVLNGVTVHAVTLPFFGSLNFHSVDLFNLPLLDEHVDLGDVLTILGIVGMANVINFIDGVDGLAAGVCAISGVTLAVIALSLDRPGAAVLAALTAGGSLGFLRHGFPPASSFMGDTGSNLLGYLLATVAITGALKTNAVVALFFPLLVLAVPILDSGFVIAKRIKYRRPIYSADTWHFHHRLANIGFSQRRTLLYLYGWVIVMAALALALRFVPYSDDHGHFNAGWTVVITVCLVAAVAASVYLLIALEILKLRRFRRRQLDRAPGAKLSDDEVDRGVARELETGSFDAVDPDTGEFAAVDPETGEFDAVDPETGDYEEVEPPRP
jgi:UDP-GlcNAc:undecaprenyl-phosphate/decaprenyl-phosphate GlcNAc-1-phosphate transferase